MICTSIVALRRHPRPTPRPPRGAGAALALERRQHDRSPPGHLPELRADFPSVARAHDALSQSVGGSGPIDERTQRLMKAGIAVGAVSDGAGLAHAARKAVKARGVPGGAGTGRAASRLDARLPRRDRRARVDCRCVPTGALVPVGRDFWLCPTPVRRWFHAEHDAKCDRSGRKHNKPHRGHGGRRSRGCSARGLAAQRLALDRDRRWSR